MSDEELKAMIAEFDLDKDGESVLCATLSYVSLPNGSPFFFPPCFYHLVNEEEFLAIMTADY